MVEYTCPNCGSSNVRFMTEVTVSAPMSMYGNLSKQNLRKKEVEIWGVHWNEVIDIYCMDCSTNLVSRTLMKNCVKKSKT